jgi:hypothetical protein
MRMHTTAYIWQDLIMPRSTLYKFNFSPGSNENCFEFLSFLFRGTFLHNARRFLDQLFGLIYRILHKIISIRITGSTYPHIYSYLFKTQASYRSNLLDDLYFRFGIEASKLNVKGILDLDRFDRSSVFIIAEIGTATAFGRHMP